MTKNGQNAGRTVLVVDDDPRCRAMIAASLSDEGFNVLVASDGYQAIGILTRPSLSILLLIVDTEMPGLHGWEVIRYARARDPRLRTLRLGRCDDIAPGAEYQSLRSLPCIPKPFTSRELLATVHRRMRQALPLARRRGALR
jgi:DNA-binding response OmpR family regulator